MIGLKGKLIVGAVIATLALGAGWKINGWRNDAAKLDAVEAQIAQYREDLAEANAKAKVDADAAAELSDDLVDIRRERDIALDELDTRPLTRTITKVLPDATPCTCDALGVDFRRMWNDPTGSRPADPGAQ
jgi:type II secretory pathway pseudopilin PulG